MNNVIVRDFVIKSSKVEDLLDLPVCITVSKFDQESVDKFSDSMSKAHNTGQPIIPIIIDSYGGEAYALLSMIEEIKSAKIPVATIARGKAMSCGAVLLSCGAEGQRYMSANAIVMIHDVASGNWGKIEELKSGVKETERIQSMVYGIMANNCGHKNKNYFLDIIHKKGHADWYLPPLEVKRHNIIQHIRMPSFTTTIKVNMEFK